MKKTMCFFAGILSLTVIVRLLTQSVFAENTDFVSKPIESCNVTLGDGASDGLYLIAQNEYEEDGFYFVKTVYSSNNPFSQYSYASLDSSNSGTITYRTNLSIYNNDLHTQYLATIWVNATFNWNSITENVTVSNITGGYSGNEGNFYKSWLSSGSNQGFTVAPLCYKYAFAQYNITFKNKYGSEKSFSVYEDCNVIGGTAHS